MIKSSIEKLSETIGFEIGASVDKLDNKSHKVIKELAEFIKEKEAV